MKSLIVEDDLTSRLIMEEFVKPFGPANVAVNGAQAVTAAQSALDEGEPYHLICMDIMMPGSDGLTAIKMIRDIEEQAGILSTDGSKIIVTTVLTDLESVSRAYQGLCDSFLVKPIHRARFHAELRGLGLIS
jgi:two-component system chemotaxis response regulator CheY